MGISCKRIDIKEYKDNYESLRFLQNNLTDQQLQNDLYKLPFQDVLGAMEKMQIFLSKGFAYIKSDQLTSVLIDKFKAKLFQKLTAINKSIEYKKLLQEDERVAELVNKLPLIDMNSEQDYFELMQKTQGEYQITIQNVDIIAKQSFPLCMRYSYDKFVELHHLKHYGRLQLGLFLKDAGMNFTEGMQFWQFHFTKRFSYEEFKKNYEYNIKYNYGLEGKRTNFTGHSCQTIINNHQPNLQVEYHGCPFKHFTEDGLKKYLINLNINNQDKFALDEIIQLKKNFHFQHACKITFQTFHPEKEKRNEDLIITHPLHYYNASRQYNDPKPKKNKSGSKQIY